MEIHCPLCARLVDENDIEEEQKLAFCYKCRYEFDISNEIKILQKGDKRQITTPPKGFAISYDGGDLVITMRWKTKGLAVLFVFTLGWNAFLFMIFGSFFAKTVPLSVVLFFIPFLGVGLYLAYFVAVSLINRTTIQVNPMEIRVRSGPIPAPGNRVIPRANINQLFVRKQVSRSSKGELDWGYDVRAKNQTGKDIILVKGLTSYEDALFIEQQIENHLGIRDAKVSGETRS